MREREMWSKTEPFLMTVKLTMSRLLLHATSFELFCFHVVLLKRENVDSACSLTQFHFTLRVVSYPWQCVYSDNAQR